MGRFDILTQLETQPAPKEDQTSSAPLPERSVPAQEPANQQTRKPVSPQTSTPVSSHAFLPESPQPVLPENPLAGKRASLRAGIPANPKVDKPANPKAGKQVYGIVEKYTTRLEPSVIRQIKIYAAEHDVLDYEVVQQAVKEFFAKK